ncbi:MAG: hypothetical protein ABI835_11980 [Chloroflexota bacterium]
MLNLIDSIDWDKYRNDMPYLDIRTALLNLNSDVEVKRKQALADLENAIEFSIKLHNTLILELVHVLFVVLSLNEFRYANYAIGLLYICGRFTEPMVTDPRNIKLQNKLKEVICEYLKEYLSLEREELDSNSRDYLSYLVKICNNE